MHCARRQMTPEQKRRVWTRVLESGGSVAEAAEQTGSSESSVDKWVRSESDKQSESSVSLSPRKREIAEKNTKVDEAIRADPHKSDRQIAKETVKP